MAHLATPTIQLHPTDTQSIQTVWYFVFTDTLLTPPSLPDQVNCFLLSFLQDDDVLVDPCIGGGVILGSASECVLVSLLSARTDMLRKLKANHPFVEDGILLSKLVMYTSKLVTRQILAIKKAEPDSFQNHFCRLEGPLMR